MIDVRDVRDPAPPAWAAPALAALAAARAAAREAAAAEAAAAQARLREHASYCFSVFFAACEVPWDPARHPLVPLHAADPQLLPFGVEVDGLHFTLRRAATHASVCEPLTAARPPAFVLRFHVADGTHFRSGPILLEAVRCGCCELHLPPALQLAHEGARPVRGLGFSQHGARPVRGLGFSQAQVEETPCVA
jgi:hypothetical protein